MIDKFAGFKTQIRILEKKLKEMDHSKLSPAKVKEVTEAIKNLKDLVKEKEDKREERKKKKEEAAKTEEAPKVEATATPTEVVKESAPAPTEEVVKEADVNKFAIDSRVEPIRGTAGSWGVIIREAGTNGDPLCYVKWMEGTLKTAHGDYGAYYPSDLRLKAEVVAEAKDPTAYVPREQLYNLEADLRGNYESMIKDLEEEHKTALEKGEATWAHRLEQKLNDAKQAYKDRFEKTADAAFKCENCGAEMGPLTQQHLENLPNGDQKWTCNKKKAEDENGSGGTNKLKVYDLNPPYDKDPQEKATGYGGDRPMGAMVAPNGDENSLPLESHLSRIPYSELKHCDDCSGFDSEPEIDDCSCHDKGRVNDSTNDKISSLKFADLDLNSIEKRWALYVDGKLALRTLTRAKADKVAKERFSEQLAAGKVEIKREDHVPVEASLDKQAIHITVAEKLFVVNPLSKTADNEYVYDVNLADGSMLFKITSKDEMGQEHLSYVIEKELTKEASKKKSFPKLGKLTSNLAFLRKGSAVIILDIIDKEIGR